MDEHVYDATKDSLGDLWKLSKQGVRILCPECRQELLVALDLETANTLRVHTGLYCTHNPAHVCEMVELRTSRNSDAIYKKEE